MHDMRISRALLCAVLLTGFAGASTLLGQDTQPADAISEVRQTLDAARKEMAAYKTAGGEPGAADHPAIKWDAALWAYRQRYPRSEAAAIASTEAVRFLVRAELWDRAHARVDSVDANDPAWERLPAVIYEEGIARKDLPYSIEKISKAAAATTNPRIKASALLVLGRAYRRQGDNDAALRSLEASKTAAPGTPFAADAEGVIYEIKHLSVGLPAPAISAKSRSGRPVTLADFRGKPVVLVFWGTT
jgi:tetratricopeptide (TPR) repeat protein